MSMQVLRNMELIKGTRIITSIIKSSENVLRRNLFILSLIQYLYICLLICHVTAHVITKNTFK